MGGCCIVWMEVWKSPVGVPRISKEGSVSSIPVRGWEWRGWSKTWCLLERPRTAWGAEWAHHLQPLSWVLPRIA